MPNIDGIDLASRLRSRHIAAPIILITGYPDDNIRAKAAVAGVYDVLLKPHIEDSLVARIRGAIQEASSIANP
jgi:FixJ family two-component response regulator